MRRVKRRLLAVLVALLAHTGCDRTPAAAEGSEVSVDQLVRESAVAQGCAVGSWEGRVVSLRCEGGWDVSLDLTNLDRRLATMRDPDERRAAVEAFLRAAPGRTAGAASADAEDPTVVPAALLRAAIKPRAVVQATMDRLPPVAREQGAIAALPLVDDVVVTVVVDRPEMMEIVTRRHLDAWKTQPSALLPRAIENLEASPFRVERLAGPSETGLVAVAMGDSYDAARLLCPKIRAAIEAELGGPAVYAIPTRELLAAARASDAPSVARLRTLAKERAEGPYAITPRLIEALGAGFRLVR